MCFWGSDIDWIGVGSIFGCIRGAEFHKWIRLGLLKWRFVLIEGNASDFVALDGGYRASRETCSMYFNCPRRVRHPRKCI
jgi:hypothetical protein